MNLPEDSPPTLDPQRNQADGDTPYRPLNGRLEGHDALKEKDSGGDGSGNAFQALQTLLLGDHAQKLEKLEKFSADPQERLDRLSADLPQVLENIARSEEKSAQLARLLCPPVEQSLSRSVKMDKSRLTEILAPIMGPAIIGYLAEFHQMVVDMLTSFLENATSPRRWRWRLEALMKGVPYAEYAAARTGDFRVLALRVLSVPVGHIIFEMLARSKNRLLANGAGTLTLKRPTLGTDLRAPKVVVLLFPGANCRLEAEVEGVPSPEVQPRLQALCEECDAWMADNIPEKMDPDMVKRDLTLILRDGFLERKTEDTQAHLLMRRASSTLLAASVVVALAAWAWSVWNWNRLIKEIKQEPGITLIEADKGWRHHRLQGLRDPLAKDVREAIGLAGWDADRFDLEFTAYQSQDPGLASQREALEKEQKARELNEEQVRMNGLLVELEADQRQVLTALGDEWRTKLTTAQTEAKLDTLRVALNLPTGFQLTLNDGLLTAAGDLEEPYYSQLQQVASRVAGVQKTDFTQVKDATRARLEEELKAFRALDIDFIYGAPGIMPEGIATVEQLGTSFRQLMRTAGLKGQTPSYHIKVSPVYGENRIPNRDVDNKRLVTVQELLKAQGMPVYQKGEPVFEEAFRDDGKRRDGLRLEVVLEPTVKP